MPIYIDNLLDNQCNQVFDTHTRVGHCQFLWPIMPSTWRTFTCHK